MAVSLLYQLPTYDEVEITSFRLTVLVPVYNERHVAEASLRRVLALEDTRRLGEAELAVLLQASRITRGVGIGCRDLHEAGQRQVERLGAGRRADVLVRRTGTGQGGLRRAHL